MRQLRRFGKKFWIPFCIIAIGIIAGSVLASQNDAVHTSLNDLQSKLRIGQFTVTGTLGNPPDGPAGAPITYPLTTADGTQYTVIISSVREGCDPDAVALKSVSVDSHVEVRGIRQENTIRVCDKGTHIKAL